MIFFFTLNSFIIAGSCKTIKRLWCDGPLCVRDFIRGYETMIVRNFNGGMDTHCSRMRQASGPGLRRANTKDEEGRNG